MNRPVETSARAQNTPWTPGGKNKKGGGRPPTKKKKIDTNAPPCHGMAYSGACKKDGCKFDHDQARCKAYAAANLDGPARPAAHRPWQGIAGARRAGYGT